MTKSAEGRKISTPHLFGSGGTDENRDRSLPEDLPVLVQEVVEWTIAFRCFVLERKVATVSSHWRDGQLAKSQDGLWLASDAELDEATQFCEKVLGDPSVSVPDAIVLDVGVIRNHGWAVVECNAAFAAGIYGCDPVAVLPVLQRACKPS